MKYLQINDEGYTPCGKWRVVPVDADSVIISRTLTPEAWKRLCNADIWPVTPKSFQRMLNVLADVAAISAAPVPAPAVPEITDDALREEVNAAVILATDADGITDGQKVLRGFAKRVLMTWGHKEGMYLAFRDAVTAPIPEEWRKVMARLLDTFERCEAGFHPHVEIRLAVRDEARALLQSAKVTDNAAADRLLEGGE